MARHPFGAGVGDWVFDQDSSNRPVLQAGAVLTFWNQRSGGSQYTNLALDQAGTTIVSQILSSDGTGGYRIGQVPLFYGPPDVTYMWASANGGERVAVGSIDSADLAGAVATQFAQHASAQNPHNTTMRTLTDVNFPASIPNGAIPVWDTATSRWLANSATGLNPASFVKTAGGSTIRIPDGDTTTIGMEMRIPAGNRAAAVNTFQTYWNSGTDAVPAWVPVFELNEYGEIRCQASSSGRVPLRIKQRDGTQTADLAQFTTNGNVPLAWITANGSVRGPNLGRSQMFTKSGTVTAGAGLFVWFNLTGVPLILRALSFWCNVAPTGAPMVFDVNLDGATLYPSTKPTLPAGQQGVQLSAALNIPAGGRLSVDVDSVGTGGGTDLTAQLDLY